MLGMNMDVIVKDVVDSVDYSALNYRNSEEIDYSKLDLSKLPSADFSDIDSLISELDSNIGAFKAAVTNSRISPDKKDQAHRHLSSVQENIVRYCNPSSIGDKEGNRYNALCEIKRSVDGFVSYTPSSVKEKANSLSKQLNSLFKKVWSIESDRQFIFRRIIDELLDKSEKYRIENYRKQIDEAGDVSLDNIQSCDSDYLTASIGYLSNRFGKGASDIVRGLIHSKKSNYGKYETKDGEILVTIGWPFSEYIESIVNCARYLNLKEFAFQGESTSALPCLNVLTKLGVSFRIEEVYYKDSWENKEYPVAIVTL